MVASGSQKSCRLVFYNINIPLRLGVDRIHDHIPRAMNQVQQEQHPGRLRPSRRRSALTRFIILRRMSASIAQRWMARSILIVRRAPATVRQRRPVASHSATGCFIAAWRGRLSVAIIQRGCRRHRIAHLVWMIASCLVPTITYICWHVFFRIGRFSVLHCFCVFTIAVYMFVIGECGAKLSLGLIESQMH